MKRLRVLLRSLALVCALPAAAPAENLTLQDCLRETALHNPMVVEQARAIERAAGTRLTLRSRALPTLSISGIAGLQGQQSDATLLTPRIDLNGAPVLDPATGKQIIDTTVQKRPSQYIVIGSGALYQPIFDVGIPASWRRGNLETAVAEQNYYTLAVAQLHATRLLFNQALLERDNGVLLAEIDKGFESNTKTVENLVNAGLAARQSLLQAQTQRANFTTAIIATTGSYRTTMTALLAAMGREQRGTGSDDLVANVHLQGALDTAPLHFDPRAITEQSLARRPDLEALRVASRSFQDDARIVRAGYYPLVKIYVSGDLLPQSVQRTGSPNALREGDNQRTTEIRPGVRCDWNVIDTGTVSGTAQQVDRAREGVDISLHRLERNVPSELSQIRAALDSAASTLSALHDNLAAAQDTLNIVAATVAQGTGSQLDFNNAQTGLLSTRSSLLQAQLQASNARAEFDRVTGGYLRFVPTARPGKIDPETRSVK